ncbi:hypothetical protein [uncultured Dialister sp.]|nr:hypothetical protein [uncultured Dialister sp.]
MLGIAAGILVGAVSGVAFYCLLCRRTQSISTHSTKTSSEKDLWKI